MSSNHRQDDTEELGRLPSYPDNRTGYVDPLEDDKGKYLVGLAFTGGGIRSASFSSGVLAEFVEKRLYGSPMDHRQGDRGNVRKEVSEYWATPRDDVARHFEKMPRVDKVLMSAVSGGGYTAASFMSWLKRLNELHDDRYRHRAPDGDAMYSLLYMTREFVRHMHVNVGYLMSDYRNCTCSWRLFYAISEWTLTLLAFLAVFALTVALFVPVFVLHTEFVVSVFNVDLLAQSPPLVDGAHFLLGTGPIWTWIYLVFYVTGSLVAVNSIARKCNWLNPRHVPVEKAPVVGFVRDFLSICVMLSITVPSFLTSNFVNAVVASLKLTEDARFRVNVAEKCVLGLLILLLVILPSGSRVQRNFFGLVLVCVIAGAVFVPLRLCDPELLEVAQVGNPPGAHCETGIPLIPKVLHLKYSRQWWGWLLFWSVFIYAGFMAFFRDVHRQFMGKFYQWRLKRAFFNRGNLSADSGGYISVSKSLLWNLFGSCSPRLVKTLKLLPARFRSLILDKHATNRDPPLRYASSSITVSPAGYRQRRSVAFHYISSLTFNLWKRIKLFYVPRNEKMVTNPAMGALTLYGPFDDPQNDHLVYYKCYESDRGLLIADQDGYHPVDTRFPSFYRILQKTSSEAYQTVYNAIREALGTPVEQLRFTGYSGGLFSSEAMGISGAVVAPDMGEHTLNRILRTFMTLTGISLGQEVSFFPLKGAATLISLPVFLILLGPFLCRGLLFEANESSLYWFKTLKCDCSKHLLSLNQAIGWGASALYFVLAVLAALTSRALNSTGARHILGIQGVSARLSRILLHVLSQIAIVRALRNVLGLSSYSRGGALTYRQMYERRQHQGLLGYGNEQEEVPAQLHLSDGGHTDSVGVIPLFCRRCDEIYIAYGGEDADGKGMEEQIMQSLTCAEQTLGCSFHVPNDTAVTEDGRNVPISDIRTALYHLSQKTFPEDAHPFYPDAFPGRQSLRPWSLKFNVVYPKRPDEDHTHTVKEGTVYLLQPRYQPAMKYNATSVDLERAVDMFNFNARNLWKRDAWEKEYNRIHKSLFGCLCQCWSTNRLASRLCKLTRNLGFLGRFPNHFTFHQCFYPRMFRAYHHHGRRAMLEALGMDSLDDGYLYPTTTSPNEVDEQPAEPAGPPSPRGGRRRGSVTRRRRGTNRTG
eukprot:gb/GECG01005995.1/.p1 GENE.gb/GECG01005995.1/~~gb/GECG01005995.1/.p1  ORF type:complete len:1152 (+),score=73.79 gb/GECG01005995.1/:1-3456(+)